MTKKIISIVLVIITILSSVAVVANAASYATGKYAVNTSAGLYVRNGAGTGYSKAGAASNGTTFNVTKVSGNWGYTPSIRCTNGVRSGWLCLDYCIYKNSGHTHNYNGGRYYEEAHPHEISVRCTSYDSCGGWKWTGETYKVEGCSQCYPSSTAYYTLSYNANGGKYAPAAQTVAANKTFSLSTQKPSRSGYTFLGWSTNKNAASSSYSPGQSVRLNGNATIYAVWKKNQTKVEATSIKINYSSYTMNVGGSKEFEATVYPSNNSNKAIYWSSSDHKVASVNGYGRVSAESPGVATITAKTENGKKATCKIIVKGVVIKGDFLYNYPVEGDVYYLSAKAYPESSKFTWSSSNSKIVSISSSGKMTAKAPGTATITAKTTDGRTVSQKITVRAANKWKTGNFDEGYTAKGYTTINLNENVGDASIKIYTYDMSGHKSSGEMHVILRDSNGKWLWEGDVKSGGKLNLGDDHGQYRVYIARKRYPNDISGISKDWLNSGECVMWAIECVDKCYSN